MNYTELKKAIRGYVENDFPTITFSDSATTFTSDEQLARFVEQAEQRIYNTIQFPSLRKNMVGSLIVVSFIQSLIRLMTVKYSGFENAGLDTFRLIE